MARFSADETIDAIRADRLVPLFHAADAPSATAVAEGVISGGLSVLEFTNRGDRAIGVFEAMARTRDEQGLHLALGAGSVIDAPTAATYLNAGADFIVSPALIPEVATACHRRGVPYLPGTLTLTEMLDASALGCRILKLFPGSAGGPAYLSAVRGPAPWLEVMPTGGVSPSAESMAGWYAAGAVAVGMGSKLLSADLVASADAAAVAVAVRRTIEARDAALAGEGE